MAFDNRITRTLGVEVPIVQAPMGWIARSQLASAVSNAGALGIIETSSGELDATLTAPPLLPGEENRTWFLQGIVVDGLTGEPFAANAEPWVMLDSGF